MFDQTFVNTHARTRKPWTVAASLALQAALLAVLLILPLLHPELPVLKLQPPPRPYVKLLLDQPPHQTRVADRVPHARPLAVFAPVLTVPIAIPQRVSLAEDAPSVAGYTVAAGAAVAGQLGTPAFSPELPAVPRPAPPVVKPEPPAAPTRMSLGVDVAKLIFAPRPRYSAVAKAARVQGKVRLQAVIAVDGSIRDLRVVSGSPLLAGLAVEAVRQWRYQPTLLSGKPVEVLTEIDVAFTLSQ